MCRVYLAESIDQRSLPRMTMSHRHCFDRDIPWLVVESFLWLIYLSKTLKDFCTNA